MAIEDVPNLTLSIPNMEKGFRVHFSRELDFRAHFVISKRFCRGIRILRVKSCNLPFPMSVLAFGVGMMEIVSSGARKHIRC